MIKNIWNKIHWKKLAIAAGLTVAAIIAQQGEANSQEVTDYANGLRVYDFETSIVKPRYELDNNCLFEVEVVEIRPGAIMELGVYYCPNSYGTLSAIGAIGQLTARIADNEVIRIFKMNEFPLDNQLEVDQRYNIPLEEYLGSLDFYLRMSPPRGGHFPPSSWPLEDRLERGYVNIE